MKSHFLTFVEPEVDVFFCQRVHVETVALISSRNVFFSVKLLIIVCFCMMWTSFAVLYLSFWSEYHYNSIYPLEGTLSSCLLRFPKLICLNMDEGC